MSNIKIIIVAALMLTLLVIVGSLFQIAKDLKDGRTILQAILSLFGIDE